MTVINQRCNISIQLNNYYCITINMFPYEFCSASSMKQQYLCLSMLLLALVTGTVGTMASLGGKKLGLLKKSKPGHRLNSRTTVSQLCLESLNVLGLFFVPWGFTHSFTIISIKIKHM